MGGNFAKSPLSSSPSSPRLYEDHQLHRLPPYLLSLSNDMPRTSSIILNNCDWPSLSQITTCRIYPCKTLLHILQEDPQACLPRIVQSLFHSPGGRFFLFSFFCLLTYKVSIVLFIADFQLKRKSVQLEYSVTESFGFHQQNTRCKIKDE